MDQLTAHLDRGWDLAQKGDAGGALTCARRALELDPKSPEVHNLLGYATALGGDTEEALEHYRNAIALDETYLEAMLNAAEVLVSPRGDWDEAIELCDGALDYAETAEEIADCVLLKVDALLGKGATEEAARVLTRIPDGPYENPSYDYLVGRAHYEVGQLDKAAPLIEAAVHRTPLHADARYYLGLVRDERGDRVGATDAFLTARALDQRDPPPAWSPSPEAFGTLVRQVIAKLEPAVGAHIRDAEVYCFDVVGAELVVDGVDPRALLILDAGPNASDEGSPEGAPRRGRIFIYQRSLERAAGSADAIAEELALALEHEIATVFAGPQKAPRDDLN
jgi:Flp pilus assembly protein TadD/predicted Zn-dependent protease with MMP-like domain